MEDSSIRMIYTANVYISIMNDRSYALSMTVSGLNCKIYLIIEDFEFHICGVYKPLKLTSSFLVNKIPTYLPANIYRQPKAFIYVLHRQTPVIH